MESPQIVELLLAMRQEMNANTKAIQEQADANTKAMQEKADASQAEMIAAIEGKMDAAIHSIQS
jgi:transposase